MTRRSVYTIHTHWHTLFGFALLWLYFNILLHTWAGMLNDHVPILGSTALVVWALRYGDDPLRVGAAILFICDVALLALSQPWPAMEPTTQSPP